MPQKTWQFIVTDGGPTNAASQKIVRQNAMRSFRRGERQAGTRKHLLSKESKRQQEVFDRDERALEDSAPEPQARSCVLKLNAGRIDPFSSTMLGGSRDAERLFTHLIQIINPTDLPLQTVSPVNQLMISFAQSALRNHNLLTTMLFHSGVHLDKLHSRGWSPTTLKYRGDSIGLLKKRLCLDDERVVDNTTISMVAFIGAAGNITGDLGPEQVHLHAMHTMVRKRGGLSKLGGNGSLAMFLSITDLMGVAIQDSLPIFDAPDLTTNTLTSHICTQRLQQPPYITDGPSFIAETRSSMQFLKDLVSLQDELIPKPNLASSSMSALTELSAAIEYRLSIARPPPGNGDSPEILLHEACRLALLICVSYTFRSFCASTMILASLSGRLTRLLQSHLSSLTKNLNIEEKRMLLWIACVGGKPASERSLYAHLVLDMMSDINIVPIFELDALLEEFVWCPRMGDWEFDMLMEEVLMVRAGDVAATETRHCITAGSLGRVVC